MVKKLVLIKDTRSGRTHLVIARERVTIFCSDVGLRLLSQADKIGADGTFKTRPILYEQVYKYPCFGEFIEYMNKTWSRREEDRKDLTILNAKFKYVEGGRIGVSELLEKFRDLCPKANF
jgi:hypothetical protein